MIHCPNCQEEIPADSSSCPACRASLTDSLSPTRRIVAPKVDRGKRESPRSPSYDSIDNARFIPGTILAERYRIVGLLGKGGMGEVYRADDLKLGQQVALKMLPEKLLGDGAALARFHREVRVARQVSHKNVCRVYDIGETGGHHFLSMEFIKGEELSSLLRRIGRLPSDKAIQLARQICAGLAAAHERGILHRDLKPANVMIDDDGNARITDFGLAGLAGEFHDEELSAGTPAYMAPEQLSGHSVTIRSDIYSLGLVLYELFTGKRVFEAATMGDLLKVRRSGTTPTTPSEIVKDLDPLIERVIARCMDKDPARRPSSALEVAAALPGGDPIAAALAAGETPSPEMVAAASREGALRPAVALSMLALLIVGMALVVLSADKYLAYGYAPLEKPREVLRERAREIISRLGYTAATDYMDRFEPDGAALEYIASNDSRPTRWEDLKDGQPAAIKYWYRQSQGYLDGFDLFRDPWTNPPPVISGMAGVVLDTRGRLLSFYGVPAQVDRVEAEVRSPNSNVQSRVSDPSLSENSLNKDPSAESQVSDRKQSSDVEWSTLFAAAGLDLGNFKPTASQWAPLYSNDSRMAWEGVYPEQSTIPIRIEAASYRGKPVYFEIVNPWSKPERQEPSVLPGNYKALLTLLLSIFLLVLIGSVLLAIRNLRLGRGDRKGALRLAIVVFLMTELQRLFSAHHVPTFGEIATILNGLQDSLFAAGFFWVVYLALEPFVRKRWPGRIISWTRLLAGDFRDPLVGRDVLIGALVGIGITLWQFSVYFVRGRLGDPSIKPAIEPSCWYLGIDQFMSAFSSQLTTPLLNVFQFLFLILLLALLFRRDWLAFFVGWIVFTVALAFLGGGSPLHWVSASVTAGLLTLALYRFGLLALLSALLYLHIYIAFPVTTHLTAWYATGFLIDLIIMLALAFYAFHTSVAGQPLFSGRLLRED